MRWSFIPNGFVGGLMSFAVSKGMILEFPNVSARHKEDLKSKKEAVVKAMR